MQVAAEAAQAWHAGQMLAAEGVMLSDTDVTARLAIQNPVPQADELDLVANLATVDDARSQTRCGMLCTM